MFSRMSDIDRTFGAMDLLRTGMDNFLSGIYRPHLSGPAFSLTSNSPRTNLVESGDSFEVQVEVPGISKDDLNIKIQGNYLEVSGKGSADTPEGYKIHRNERDSSSFSRSFTLPEDVNAERAEAVLKNGILYLTLPKSETAKPKQITIN